MSVQRANMPTIAQDNGVGTTGALGRALKALLRFPSAPATDREETSGDGDGQARRSQILIVGDSHTSALKKALLNRAASSQVADITVARLEKTKGGVQTGDASLTDLASVAAHLSAHDALVLAVGGNNYSVFGLVRHPVAFDVLMPGEQVAEGAVSKAHIPYRVLESYFAKAVGRGNDFTKIKALTEGVSAPIYYLIPPPPKANVAHIMRNPESLFAKMGLHELGVSPPSLLRKLWQIQSRAAQVMCGELSIAVLDPPREAVTPDGFLIEKYYGGDATHANARYGELVLRQVEVAIAGGKAEARKKAE